MTTIQLVELVFSQHEGIFNKFQLQRLFINCLISGISSDWRWSSHAPFLALEKTVLGRASFATVENVSCLCCAESYLRVVKSPAAVLHEVGRPWIAQRIVWKTHSTFVLVGDQSSQPGSILGRKDVIAWGIQTWILLHSVGKQQIYTSRATFNLHILVFTHANLLLRRFWCVYVAFLTKWTSEVALRLAIHEFCDPQSDCIP